MNNTLWMYDYVNTIIGNVKQPLRFDNFQALIHQCCTVNSNFWTHMPGWMGQSLRNGNSLQLFKCCRTERAAGRSQKQTMDIFRSLTTQTLPDSAVLTVNR